ncbi:hypothetical protein IFO70_23500 [Phormidium tenue FACHB-886]|nr:hypothetical protein [Phormidium tenue FACHB-886]
MTEHHGIAGVFPFNTEANRGVLELQEQGFDICKLSLAKTTLPSGIESNCFLYRMPPTATGVSLIGATEAGVLFDPGTGPIMIAGSIAGKLVSWVEAMMASGIDPAPISLLSGLSRALGIPQHKALKYETEIRAGQFVLLVSGSHEEIRQAQQILQNAGYPTGEANQQLAAEIANGYPPHPLGAHPPHLAAETTDAHPAHPIGAHPPHPAGIHSPRGAHPPHPAGIHPPHMTQD